VVAITLTNTVPRIVPVTLKSDATTAADTEARALAMTWMGLTVSLGGSSDVEDGVRVESGGDWGMGSRSRQSESPRLSAGLSDASRARDQSADLRGPNNPLRSAAMDAPRTYRQFRFQPPPGSTEVLLVRHGESEPAVEGQDFDLVNGQGDPALSPEGRQQAELVGERLSEERIDAIYVSSLRRTVQTAEPLARRLSLTPVVEPDLREVFLGEWEGGLFRQKVIEQDPITLRMYEEQRWDVIPGAESAAALTQRVRAAIERIAAAHPDQRVVAFSHGGTIGEVLAQASHSLPFAFNGADNASISHVVITKERWAIRRFNDTAHLGAGLTTRAAPLT
jgi:probable phosphoglycerate mutase